MVHDSKSFTSVMKMHRMALYVYAILCSVHFLFHHCTDGALCHIMLCKLSVLSLYRRCPMPYYALYTFCFITVQTVPYAILCSVHFLFYHCTDGALCHIMLCTLSVLSLYRRCPMPYYVLYTFCFITVQTVPYAILCSVHFLFYHCTDGALCHIMLCTLSVLSLYSEPYAILCSVHFLFYCCTDAILHIICIIHFLFITVQTVVTLVPDANTQPIRIERCAANTEMFGYRNQATTVDKELQ